MLRDLKRFQKLSGLAFTAIIVLPLLLQPALAYGANADSLSPMQKITHSVYCTFASLFNPSACDAADEQVPPSAIDESEAFAARISDPLPFRAPDTELPERNVQSAPQIIQPVVERTVHTREIVRESGITQDQFDIALNNLRQQISSAQAVLPASYGAPVARSIPNTWGLTQRIDQLSGVDLSGGTITATPITNSPISGGTGSFTDFLATNSTTTSATTTNFFTTSLTALSGFFTDLVSLNATFTNATTTDFVATGATALNTLTTTGNTSIAGTLGVTGTTTLVSTTLVGPLFDASSSAGNGGELLTSTGTSTVWGTIGGSSITADSLDWSEFADAMTLDTNTTIDMDTNGADLNFDSNTLVINSSTNRVGIGTATPGAKLDVAGITTAHSFTFSGNSNTWELNGRGTDAATWGVPYFRSLVADSPTALDIMPNGTGGSQMTGKAWIDVCNSDLSPTNSTDFQCALLTARSDGIAVGSHAGGAFSELPLTVGGTTIYFNDKALSGTEYGQFSSFGFYLGNSGTGHHAWFTTNELRVKSSYGIRWLSGTSAYSGSIDTGLYRNAAGIIEINNGTSGEYRDLQIRALNPSSGNVGIGTTDPLAKLHVSTGASVGTPNANTRFFNEGSIEMAGTDAQTQYLFFSDTAGYRGFVSYAHNGDEMFLGTGASPRIGISSAGKVGIGLGWTEAIDAQFVVRSLTGSDIINLLDFSGNERMTVLNTGNVGIGETTPADKLDVAGDIRVGTGTTGCVKDADGTSIAGTCSSDERLKTDIADLPDILDNLVELSPVSYHWNETAADLFSYGTTSEQIGLIAQQVEAHLPALVTEDAEGYKQIRFSDLPIYLLKGMREMWSTVAGIINRVDTLEARIEQLESQLATSGAANVSADNDNSSTPEPTILLRGNDPANVALGVVYSDLGVIAKDANGNDISVFLLLDGEPVDAISLDTSTSTTHIITYSVEGGQGTAMEITRTVIIGEPEETEAEDSDTAEPEANEAEEATDEPEITDGTSDGVEENADTPTGGQEDAQQPEEPTDDDLVTTVEDESGDEAVAES